MKRIVASFLDYRLLLITIYVLLLQYFFLKGEIANYQLSNREMYLQGNKLSKLLVYLVLLLSLFYPLIIKFQKRYSFREKLIVVFIGFVPALYHMILYILSIFSK